MGIAALPVLHNALRRRLVTSAQFIDTIDRRFPLGESETGSDRARDIAAAIYLGARLWRLQDTSCVSRSLLTWAIARSEGIHACIRIGVDPHTRRTHAWTEVGGVAVDDTADVATRYLPLDGVLDGGGTT